MDLQRHHTAICLHWPNLAETEDQTFMLLGTIQGPALEKHLDLLLDEHAPADSRTEVQVFWHTPDGQWDLYETVVQRGALAS